MRSECDREGGAGESPGRYLLMDKIAGYSK
jgi:hypothetical protein